MTRATASVPDLVSFLRDTPRDQRATFLIGWVKSAVRPERVAEPARMVVDVRAAIDMYNQVNREDRP